MTFTVPINASCEGWSPRWSACATILPLKLAKAGFKVIQTGGIAGVKWAYFDTDEDGGIIIELGQRLSQ